MVVKTRDSKYDVVIERNIERIVRVFSLPHGTYRVEAVFDKDNSSLESVEIKGYKTSGDVKVIRISRYPDEGVPKYFIERIDSDDYDMLNTREISRILYTDRKGLLKTLENPETFKNIEDEEDIKPILDVICNALSEEGVSCEEVYSVYF